jgi:hypothetical protein
MNKQSDTVWPRPTPGSRGYQQLVLAICASVALVVLLSTCFMPIWESNDDVGMSMIAHGYGFIAQASPKLLFSNVVWGHIVRALPQIGNVLGYTIATMLVLGGSSAAILFYMMRMGTRPLTAGLTVVLIMIWPLLFPQFTLTAGLLAVAAVLGWRAYAETRELFCLVTACMLAFLSYAIRDQQFWLTLAIALPVYPWQALMRDRRLQVALVLLAVSIAGAFALNKAAYDDEAWTSFQAFNLARAPYTDFRVGDQVKDRPDILARHGYSANDIDLIAEWFFVDPGIADPARLNAMIAEVGLKPLIQRGLGMGLEALRSLWVPQLWPMLICALVIIIVSPARRAIMLAALILAAVFALGAIGRPGVTRVYYPLSAFLLLAAVLFTRGGQRTHAVAILALLAAIVAAAPQVWSGQAKAQARIALARSQVEGMPSGTLVVWSGTFPFEATFAPFDGIVDRHAVRIYPMGVSTYAPYSVAVVEEAAGRGFVKRLTSQAGLNVTVASRQIELLRIYCREHFRAPLDVSVVYEALEIYNLRCLPSEARR